GDHKGHGGSDSAAATASAPAPAARSGFSGARSGGYRYSGARMIAPSQRFSSFGTRSTRSGLGPYAVRSSNVAVFNQRRITPGTFNRGNGLARFENGRSGNLRALRSDRGNNAGSIRNGHRGLTGVNNRVVARRSADWQRNWDRHSDHWWHGHRCHFVNGYWFIYDFGFDPWYPYPYYASNYYASDYYYGDPYAYEGGVYESAPSNYSDEEGYNSSKDGRDAPIGAVQERLAKQGYYRGEIDGVFGAETQRAIMRYQSDKGLAPTGKLSGETLQSLGLR
ncbi:MAG: peptidoglycan-binding domain-containing protein, partial [Verrucomicrobiota bacterium]